VSEQLVTPLRYAGYGDRSPVQPPRRRGIRHLYQCDRLQHARVWMTGPHWRKCFGVQRAMTVLLFSFEEDVRELVLEEIRPGVYAQWSDPRERFGLLLASRRRQLDARGK
jgi:hypothetical protein